MTDLASPLDVPNRVLRAADRRIDRLADRLTELLIPILEQAGARAASEFQRRATNHLTAAAPGLTATATMIAVKPTPEQASRIWVTDGEDRDTLHVTLAFLGDVHGDLEAVAEALRPVAAVHAPLSGTVGGVGSFVSAPDAPPPRILLPDVPGLVELRVAVTEALARAGIGYSRLHGFCPHMTVAYGADGDGEELQALGEPLSFGELLVVRSDAETIAIPLVGPPPLTASTEDEFLDELAEAMSKPISDPDRPVDRLYFGPVWLRCAECGANGATVITPTGCFACGAANPLRPLTAAGEPPPWSSPAGAEILDIDALVKTLRAKTDPIRRALIEAAMTPTLKTAGLDFDVTNPFTANVLAQSGSQVTHIAETTRANVMRTIRASYREGLSIPDTAKAIQAGMREAAPARARMIARTELAGAVNGGSLAATQIVSGVTGDVYYKQWLTAPGAVNPRHEEYDGLDGQTVALDDNFDVGGAALDFPGDPGGEPGETINCRCTLAFTEKEPVRVDSGVGTT